ncbi:MAG: hypothetical protein ACRD1E_02390, partial [Terriglobales bacterium]
MAMFLLGVVLFLAVALGVFGLGLVWMAPGSAAGSRLRQMLGIDPPPKPTLAKQLQNTLERAIDPASRLLPPSAKQASQTRRWLIQAGYREERHARYFFGIRTLMVLGLLAAVLGTGIARRTPLALLVAVALGMMLPRFLLKKRLAARSKRIRLSLPDALDLLVICVEAGLGLDQAIQRVSAELKTVHPDLCGEFELMS